MAKRAAFTLDPNKTILISTGQCAPVTKWIDGAAPGAIRPQDTDPDTGKPLWVIDALDESDPEADRAIVVGIRVASNTEPHPAKYQPLAFDSLTVSCYVRKADAQLVSMYAGVLKAAAAQSKAA